MNKQMTLTGPVSWAGLLAAIIVANPAWAIKKCQDPQGRWHYGDVAVAACENSKVTTLDERGFVTENEEKPKTEDELAALEQAKQEAEAKKLVQEERRRILSIYETENDIDRLRDNQIRTVQSNIDIHNNYLKSMHMRVDEFTANRSATSNETQISEWDTKISQAQADIKQFQGRRDQLIREKEEIMEKFRQEKETYNRLVNSEE